MRICIYVPNVVDKDMPDKKGSTKAVFYVNKGTVNAPI